MFDVQWNKNLFIKSAWLITLTKEINTTYFYLFSIIGYNVLVSRDILHILDIDWSYYNIYHYSSSTRGI